MALKPPCLPNESAANYIRRTTLAEGVPEALIVTTEHPFWAAVGGWLKRWQMIVGLGGVFLLGGVTFRQYDGITKSLTLANEKLISVVTKEDLDRATKDLTPACVAATITWLKSAGVTVNFPNYQTRGQPYKGRVVDIKSLN